jgi:phage terminase large subunit GpA-like protein
VIYGRLKRVSEPGPGYFHFDSGADEAFFDQLASEVIVRVTKQGRLVRAWKPRAQGIRQEGLDGTVYAYAAMIGRGGMALLEARGAKWPVSMASEAAARDSVAPSPGEDASAAASGASPTSSSMDALMDTNRGKKSELKPPRLRKGGWMRRRW